MSRRLPLLILCCLLDAARAEDPARCSICSLPIAGAFYWVTSPARPDRVPVCPECAKLDAICYVCGLPVGTNALKLRDGRLLCTRDAQPAVFSAQAMDRIFGEVKQQLQRMFRGTGRLPGDNIKVTLVDGLRLRRLHRAAGVAGDPERTTGLTQSYARGNSRWEHHVYLLNGLGSARLAATAAHEWTHTWITENVPDDRHLATEAIEGFCELTAYRVMRQRQEGIEQAVIRANAYTRGQISLLTNFESEPQFRRIADWIRSGTDVRFDADNTRRLLERPDPTPFKVLWRPTVATVVPDTLELRGIGGRPDRRLALINNRTLEKGESAAVRLGTTSLTVRCLDVRADSVLVLVQGESAPRELQLRSTAAPSP